MNTGGVLTLDLAGIVGWAHGIRTANVPTWGTWALPRVGGEGARYAYFENELYLTLKRLRPSSLVLEAPLPLPAQTDMRTCQQQLTLRGIAYLEGWRASVAVSEISALTVRMELMGTARFKKGEVKKEVLAFCQKLGWAVRDHNAADACMIWLWHTRRVSGMPPIAGPLFQRTV